MISGRKSVCFAILSLFMSLCGSANAYDEEVHNLISLRATEYSQLREVLSTQLGFQLDPNEPDILRKLIGSRTIKDWVAFGGKAEDDGKVGKRGDFIFKATTRGYNHFHDPLRDWNEAGLISDANAIYRDFYWKDPVSALLWALDPEKQAIPGNTPGDWSWSKARSSFYFALTYMKEEERNQYFADCFRALGQVIHLLQDMSVPLHTRNDLHVFPLEGLPEIASNARWTYETYTYKKRGDLDYTPDQSGDRPHPSLLQVPVVNADPEYTDLVAATGLIDRNVYQGQSPIPRSDILGLAEYSNANFLTQDTMWKYPHPNLDDTNYYEVNWLSPEPVVAEDGEADPRIYLKKILGESIDYLAAPDYWSFEYWGYVDSIPVPFILDEKCFENYASKLIPRAVGYSAALLDYFFRGSLEISAPDRFLYSIIDGSDLPQEFNHIKAKVRNTTAKEKNEQGQILSYEEMGPGTLVGVAKYKKRTDYQPDLSTDPPTQASREPHFSYSVSAPIEITSLDSDVATEFTFDFSDDPIPAGITDLYFQVIFRGTLGNEEDVAVAVGMKDLMEPMHILSWNSTDRFYLYHQLYTPEEIKKKDELFNLLPPGFHIDPYDVETGAAFSSDGVVSYNYHAYTPRLPPERFTRIIILTDSVPFHIFVGYYSESPPISSWFDKPVEEGVINQEDSDGKFEPQPAELFTFRGQRAHVFYTKTNFFPDDENINSAPWPLPSNPSPLETQVYP